jgi:hypothetical protein
VGPQVREVGEQMVVRPNLMPLPQPICERGQEHVGRVVRKCSSIARKGCRARGVIGQDLRQHCLSHPLCFVRRVSARVLQRVREAATNRRSSALLLWPSFRQIDLHQMTVRMATFKLLRAVLRAPAIVSAAAILIAGRVTDYTDVI